MEERNMYAISCIRFLRTQTWSKERSRKIESICMWREEGGIDSKRGMRTQSHVLEAKIIGFDMHAEFWLVFV